MSTILKKISSGEYLKDIIALSIGSILAQLIMIIVSPIITRIYTPAELGAYTLLMTVIFVIGPNINGRYDYAIVSSQDKTEADALTVTSIFVCFVMTIIIGVFLTIIYFFDQKIFKDIGLWIFILIPILLITGLTNILISFNNKYKQYKLISSVSVTRSIAQAIGQVLFGLIGLGASGLYVSQLLSSLLGIKKQSEYFIKDYKSLLSIKKEEVIKVFIKYKKQPIYSLPANVMNALSFSLTYFFITSLYGLNEVGYYSLCQRILGLPITLICMNVARVFFRKASETKKEKGNFFPVLIKTIPTLSLLSLPIFLVLYLFADKLFLLVFGPSWEVAGKYVQIMSPMFAFRFIIVPVMSSLIVGGKQNLELVMQSVFIILSCAIFLLTKMFNYSIETYLLLTTITFSINYIIILFVIIRISKLKNQ
ncbi:lipopolysaccharide biosynthesis protein [Paenibacillus agricola]|uniref:Oligosaccharide flippase family protein n=1 Tax=Paenibacillus agricola TaxID=2716264 RepID=A0ABX0JIP5_9BACL|nr:oligosaccharide flippase family protein [Paenibacillus agricola]NHN34329.1 oligosaccharide flippase family protein [Paenibacillus agricola]